MKWLVLLGRIFYSLVFIIGGAGHFSQHTVEYGAVHGVWMAPLLVPVSGILALLGGLSILLGYRAKIGAWFLVIFLVPVTLTMHRFWGIPDPLKSVLEQVMFLKNLAALGAALLIAYFGSGPLSLDKAKLRF